MSKRYLYLAMVAVSALAMSFTSCKDNNEPQPEPQKEKTPVASFMDFKATFDTLTIQMCDISFEYYEGAGNKKTEKVTTTVWERNLETKGLNATYGYHMNIDIKADLDTTINEHFVVAFGYEYKSGLLAEDGTELFQSKDESGAFSISNQMAMRKREAVMQIIKEKMPAGIVHVYTDGKFSLGTWE